ncbi:hypothetical protein BK816_08215 [Boudabousia tangfeifanii]|uniref:Uncharacterized protein n=2 Tax=Boudabousia tangfeifanii TaxID=1912795 RepID=A0A1D9MM00_9ACTO|nr:hypothetical protein BK816_08215 [Boudabousia tangfeifanii]
MFTANSLQNLSKKTVLWAVGFYVLSILGAVLLPYLAQWGFEQQGQHAVVGTPVMYLANMVQALHLEIMGSILLSLAIFSHLAAKSLSES